MDASLTELTPKQSTWLFAIALVLLTTHHELPHQATLEELLVGGHEVLGPSPYT